MAALVPPLWATPPAQACRPCLREGYWLSLTSLNCVKSFICLRLPFLIFPYTSAPFVSGQKLPLCCLPACSVGNRSVYAGFGGAGCPLLGMHVFLGPQTSSLRGPDISPCTGTCGHCAPLWLPFFAIGREKEGR